MACPSQCAGGRSVPGEYVIASTEESLRNLGLETIDVQQFHVWSDEWATEGDWLTAIQQSQGTGQASAFWHFDQRLPTGERD